MRRAEDLTGKVFGNGMITVLGRAENGNTRNPRWRCRCACGREFVEYGHNLKAGRRVSCGCLRSAGTAIAEKDATRSADSLYRLRADIGASPWETLAAAIVAVAADDYRFALDKGDERVKGLLAAFFHSGWYSTLTKLDGDLLVSLLEREKRENPDKINI